jgi:hypothetical protein
MFTVTVACGLVWPKLSVTTNENVTCPEALGTVTETVGLVVDTVGFDGDKAVGAVPGTPTGGSGTGIGGLGIGPIGAMVPGTLVIVVVSAVFMSDCEGVFFGGIFVLLLDASTLRLNERPRVRKYVCSRRTCRRASIQHD